MDRDQEEEEQQQDENFFNEEETDQTKQGHSQMLNVNHKINRQINPVNKRQKLNQDHQIIDFCSDPANSSSQFQLKVLCTGNF